MQSKKKKKKKKRRPSGPFFFRSFFLSITFSFLKGTNFIEKIEILFYEIYNCIINQTVK